MCRHSPALFLWQEISAYLDVCRGVVSPTWLCVLDFPTGWIDSLQGSTDTIAGRKKTTPLQEIHCGKPFHAYIFVDVLFGLSHFVPRENNWTPFSLVWSWETWHELSTCPFCPPASLWVCRGTWVCLWKGHREIWVCVSTLISRVCNPRESWGNFGSLRLCSQIQRASGEHTCWFFTRESYYQSYFIQLSQGPCLTETCLSLKITDSFFMALKPIWRLNIKRIKTKFLSLCLELSVSILAKKEASVWQKISQTQETFPQFHIEVLPFQSRLEKASTPGK